MQREKESELVTHSSKWHPSIKSLPSELREAHGKGGRKSVRTRGDRGPLNQVSKAQVNAHRLKPQQRLTRVCTARSSAYALEFSAEYFSETPRCVKIPSEGISDSCAFSWESISSAGLSRHDYLVMSRYFDMICC